MQAMEVLLGNATAPSNTVLTAVTAAAGNSFTIRSFNDSTQPDGSANRAHLLTASLFTQGTGSISVKSPRFHDYVKGLYGNCASGIPMPVIPAGAGADQPIHSQDNLTVTGTGSATGGKIEEYLLYVYYEDLPGVATRLISPTAMKLRALNEVGILCTITAGAGGGWTGAQAITATDNRLKAGTDYALVGMTFNVDCGAARIYGADTGNLGVGVPGGSKYGHYTSNFFSYLSLQYGVGLIPIINGSNAPSTQIDVAQNDGGAAVNVILQFVELAAV